MTGCATAWTAAEHLWSPLMGLTEYKRKRHFSVTPEPKGSANGKRARRGNRFIVQKHAARRLHYDFRLEIDGVLKSWAVPKGPSLDSKVKSLAVQVEDHPIEYGSFEGTIPENQYGAGTVMVWDRGTWEPEGDPKKGYRDGKLKFQLDGEKLRGGWMLIRMSGRAGERGQNWLLKKLDDTYARPGSQYDVLDEKPESVASGRTLEEIAAGDREWSNGRARKKKTTKKPAAQKKQTRSANRSTVSPSSLTGAVRRRQPDQFQPQLATLVKQVPEADDWLHELKFDGYRLVCLLSRGKPRLLTRRGKDWTHRFPTVAQAVRGLTVKNAILDGEVVVLAPGGKTDFQALQNLLQRKRDVDIVWFVFDLPYCDGYDLTQTPLVERKALLQQVLEKSSSRAIRYSDHIVGNGPAVFSDACRRGLEGLVSKRLDSPYEQRRTHNWMKVKCVGRQEFVVVGWTEPSGERIGFGALLLGYYDKHRRLIYAGRVGTGFNAQSLQQLAAALKPLERDQPAVDNRPSGSEARGAHWVDPQLVVEVAFTEWTKDGRLRHPSFQGLREDKKPQEIVREQPVDQSVESTNQHHSNGDKSRRQKTRQSKQSTASQNSSGVRRLRATSRRSVTATLQNSKNPAGFRRLGATSRRSAMAKSRDSSYPAGVRLTHPDRLLYPEQGLTKRDLADYYAQIADWILPHLIHRPLTLVRCPSGREGQCFFQKHLVAGLPAPVRGIKVKEQGGTHQYVAIDDLAGLVTLVQMSALEFHPWGSREDKLDYPDRMILDLDPGPGVSWSKVVAATREVRGIMDSLGLQSFVRTTGGKGLHVVVPLVRRATWEVVKVLAQTIAELMARQDPSMYVATSSKARRTGKIYVDYLRNARGATAIASYSTRAKSGAPVATPLDWDELSPRMNPAKFNVKTVTDRLASMSRDPWEGFFDVRQSATEAMTKKLQK